MYNIMIGFLANDDSFSVNYARVNITKVLGPAQWRKR